MKKSVNQRTKEGFEAVKTTMLSEIENAKTNEERLSAMKAYRELCELQEKSKTRVSPDTLLIVGGNLIGIVLILGYEHLHVVTSKALGFVLRGRV
jgi:hypothetical protein